MHLKKLSSILFVGIVLTVGLVSTGVAANNMTNPTVLINTNKGSITVELEPARAPITVENFLDYVNKGFYTDTIFHRVIPNFMIQGGGYTTSLQEKRTNPPIAIESDNGLKNNRGTIAMARTNIPNSATSQFYINVIDNDFLNYRNNSPQGVGYTVFGKVIDGMDTVDSIAAVQTGLRAGMQNVPYSNVVIESITQIEK